MLRAILVDDEDLSVRMLESIVDWRRYGVEITATEAGRMHFAYSASCARSLW